MNIIYLRKQLNMKGIAFPWFVFFTIIETILLVLQHDILHGIYNFMYLIVNEKLTKLTKVNQIFNKKDKVNEKLVQVQHKM